MTDNGRRSFSRERNRRPRALPFQRQYAAALPPRLDRDRELLHGLRERLHLHVQAGEVVLRGVVGAPPSGGPGNDRSEEHTSELQSPCNLVCRLLLEKKKKRLG